MQFISVLDMISTSSGTGKKSGVGSGKETLRLRSTGPATVQVVSKSFSALIVFGKFIVCKILLSCLLTDMFYMYTQIIACMFAWRSVRSSFD